VCEISCYDGTEFKLSSAMMAPFNVLETCLRFALIMQAANTSETSVNLLQISYCNIRADSHFFVLYVFSFCIILNSKLGSRFGASRCIATEVTDFVAVYTDTLTERISSLRCVFRRYLLPSSVSVSSLFRDISQLLAPCFTSFS
jgi:hypothetical protein